MYTESVMLGAFEYSASTASPEPSMLSQKCGKEVAAAGSVISMRSAEAVPGIASAPSARGGGRQAWQNHNRTSELAKYCSSMERPGLI
jgi:hypothetical protein